MAVRSDLGVDVKFALEYADAARYLLDMPKTMKSAISRFEVGDVLTVRHPDRGEVNLEVEAVRYFIDLPSGGLAGSPFEAMVCQGELRLSEA